MEVSDQLLQKCKKNDRKGQEAIYRLLFPPSFKIAMRYAKNEADAKDILNKAFLKAFIKIETFNGDGKIFFGWLKRIIVNQALDYLKQSNFSNSFAPIEEHEDVFYHDELRERDDYENVVSLIQKLPDTSKCVFNLFVIDGFSHREIADQLGISEDNSRYHLRAARQQLKSWIFKTESL